MFIHYIDVFMYLCRTQGTPVLPGGEDDLATKPGSEWPLAAGAVLGGPLLCLGFVRTGWLLWRPCAPKAGGEIFL